MRIKIGCPLHKNISKKVKPEHYNYINFIDKKYNGEAKFNKFWHCNICNRRLIK